MNIPRKLFSFGKKEVAFFFKNARIKRHALGLKLYALRSQSQWPNDNLMIVGTTTVTYGKLLIITPRHSGKACDRNLFRRRIKALYYEEKLYLIPVVFALYAYREGVACDFPTLKDFLISTLNPSA